MSSPKRNVEKLNKLVTALETLAPDKSFGGMTLAQFKARIQPSYDIRAQIETLDTQLSAAKAARRVADEESMRAAQLIVNGVKGDPTEGPNSDLYEAMGYTRADERKSGLTRKKKTSDK
ncbi:MAG: hypothetical protein ICV60_00535 [Pyrinomonadaceae bacterium]|nr:hypothetical protein [Pyrinomonadaceae bacterium]